MPQEPVFDTTKCPVPFVQRIPELQIIQNCDIPQAPDPIQDCPDFNIALPNPRPPGPPCPQIQQDTKNSGFMEDLPGFPPPAILLSFELVEPDLEAGEEDEQKEDDPCKFQVQIQLPCPQFVQSKVQCLTGPECILLAEIVPILDLFGFPVLKDRCQFQLQVQLTIQSSSKTAIVAVGDEFVGLYCHEMPESWFSDVLTTQLVGMQTEVPIDPMFLQVVNKNGIKVLSVVPEHATMFGARIVRDQVVIKRPREWEDVTTDATVVVAGIRRGFGKERFTRFTKEQKEVNDQFWSRAHKPKE